MSTNPIFLYFIALKLITTFQDQDEGVASPPSVIVQPRPSSVSFAVFATLLLYLIVPAPKAKITALHVKTTLHLKNYLSIS